jgi:dihydrodipicolinate synthase/N-acetylneuraminate lyase
MEKFTSKNFKILMIAVVILLGVLVYGLNAGTSVFSNVFGTVSAPLLTAGDEYHRGRKGIFKFGRHVQRGA